MIRRLVIATAVLIGVVAVGPAVPAGASSPVEAAPYCGITWGSGAKTAGPSGSASHLVNVRVGQHPCYDRMVFDLDAAASGYSVRYVTEVRTDGQGQVIPLAGGAKLEIIVRAPAVDAAGNATYPAVVPRRLPGVDLAGFRTFRAAKFGGTFEGQTTIGLGVRARLPFRVVKLGDRIVLDVAHRW